MNPVKLFFFKFFIYVFTLIYSIGFCFWLLFYFVTHPTKKFWKIKNREKPPQSLLDQSWGQHGFMQLKVSYAVFCISCAYMLSMYFLCTYFWCDNLLKKYSFGLLNANVTSYLIRNDNINVILESILFSKKNFQKNMRLRIHCKLLLKF